MRVLILGFETKEEIDAEMERLMAEGPVLFSVVCGNMENAAYEYALMRGAPVLFSRAKTPQGLLKEADYLVMKLEASSPQWMKNLTMAWKKEGKHGTVVK